MKKLAFRLLTGLLACQLAASAIAQADWPTHSVRIIVPAPAAGPFDRAMRPIAQHMSGTLKQPVVIDNRPSAGNIVGTQAGAAAAPDGYTLTMTGMLNTIAAGMYANVPFDIVKDFEHVAVIGGGPQWLVVRSDAGVNSLAELIQKAKQQPGKIDYASSGAGSTGHLMMELLQRNAGIQLTHVPYKGGAPALQDLLSGVVPLLIVPPGAAQTSVENGKLKVLAVSSDKRSPANPDIPTFAELGYPQLTVTSWVGLSAPKGTPAPVVRKIQAALKAALQDPAVSKQLETDGMVSMSLTQEQFAQLVRDDTERWGKLVRSLNIKAN